MAKIKIKYAFLIASFYTAFLLFSFNFFGLFKSNISAIKNEINSDFNERYNLSKIILKINFNELNYLI